MKPITIVSATTLQHNSTKKAIERTIAALPVPVKEVIVFGNKPLIEGATFVETKISSFYDYNQLILKGIDDYINTDHFLIVQYDGFAVNKNLWDKAFLKYDYIGAPWPHVTPGGISCGNGGFSLRSKKLSSILKNDSVIQLDQNNSLQKNEDQVICNFFGDYLAKEYQIKFAPRELAGKFSFEKSKVGAPGETFGMHAIWNVPLYLSEEETLEVFKEIKTLAQKPYDKTLRNCAKQNYQYAFNYVKTNIKVS